MDIYPSPSLNQAQSQASHLAEPVVLVRDLLSQMRPQDEFVLRIKAQGLVEYRT